MLRNHLLISVVLIVLGFTCNSASPTLPPETTSSDLPTRRALFRNMREAKKLTIVYSDSNYQPIVDSIAKNPRFEIQITGKKTSEVNFEDLKSGAFFLIGTPDNNPLIQQISAELPLNFKAEGFEFDNTIYNDPGDVFKLYLYPNPKNPSFPIYLITGNSEEAIMDMLDRKYSDDWSSLMWASWGYEVYQRNNLNLLGYFSDTTWQMDKAVHFDFIGTSDTLGSTPHFVFISQNHPYEKGEILPLMKQCEASYENISSFVGKDTEKRIQFNLFPSIEQKGLMLHNTDPAHCDFKQFSVCAVVNDNFQGQQWQKENELLVRHFLGQSQKLALEKGLAIYFSNQWQKKGYHYWTQRLYQSGNLPSVAALLNNDEFKSDSELVVGTAAASLVESLIQMWGKEAFLKQYPNWNPSFKEIGMVENYWHKQLERSPVEVQPKVNKGLSFLKGFNFAHEGYRIYNGYGSDLARQSLVKLDKLGSNAVAIVPYSYMRNSQKPSQIPVMQDAGTETDESVIFSHLEAKKMGMYTLLKPQIWLGSSWPGDIEMASEEDWKAFFNNYYRWIRHYAMLAEIHEMDGLSLGVEFAKATIQRPKDWQGIIKRIRTFYTGHLTYSANWGEEFEKFTLWEEFDYIGLNCYYPLSKKKQVNKSELKKGFQTIADKIEQIALRHKKPIVFTEIGFRSVEQTWENPHDDAKGRAVNESAQDLCYEIIFEELEKRDWCKGILWWKWPSYMSHRGNNPSGFTPCGKQAERTVEKWFKKL